MQTAAARCSNWLIRIRGVSPNGRSGGLFGKGNLRGASDQLAGTTIDNWSTLSAARLRIGTLVHARSTRSPKAGRLVWGSATAIPPAALDALGRRAHALRLQLTRE